MKHCMVLNAKPFAAVASGAKTIELRMYDEKRRQVRVGDEIEFCESSDAGHRILTRVVALHRFASFEELYRRLPLERCGYDAVSIQTASPADMNAYYSPEEQKRYGVVGIEIERL